MEIEKYKDIIDEHLNHLHDALGDEACDLWDSCQRLYYSSFDLLNEYSRAMYCVENLFVIMLQSRNPEKVLDGFLGFLAVIYRNEDKTEALDEKIQNLCYAMCRLRSSNIICFLEECVNMDKYKECFHMLNDKTINGKENNLAMIFNYQ